MPSNDQQSEGSVDSEHNNTADWSKKNDKGLPLLSSTNNDSMTTDSCESSPPGEVKWEFQTPERDEEDIKKNGFYIATMGDLAKNNNEEQTRLDNPKMKPEDIVETEHGEWQKVAPDGGWGWMVLLGSVIVNTLVPGLLKSFGILFIEFLNVFNASPSSAAWIPGLTFALYNLLGPLASALSNRFSCRFTTLVGGLFAAFGLALSYFATSIEFLYLSYGLLGGIGAGLSYTPGILIVGRYFEKRRGLANGICMSGSALGSIILPPLLNYLLSEYSYRGAILIMCGVLLNVCVGAALYQPVEWHLKREWVVTPTATSIDNVTGNNIVTNQQRSTMQTSFEAMKERKVSWLPLTSPDDVIVSEANQTPRASLINKYQDGTIIVDGHSERPGTGVPLVFGSRSTIGGNADRLRRTMSVTSTLSSSSFAYMSTIHLGSTAAAYQCTEAGQLGSIGKLDTPPQVPGWCSHLGKLFDVKLLGNTVFLLITYSYATSGIAYTNLLIVLPAHAYSLGVEQADYAMLLSIIATMDLTGRVMGAWLSDMGLFPRKYFFIAGLTLSGVVLGLMPFATDFNHLAVNCALFGLASGAYIGLMAVLLMDHLGPDRLASTFGLCLAINGIIMLAGPPAVGTIREQIGSYQPVLHILGIILISGGAIWILEPLATRHEEKKELIRSTLVLV